MTLQQLRRLTLTEVIDMDFDYDPPSDPREEDERDEFNAQFDDHFERYAQRCSGCGTPTYGGDCPNCYEPEEN